MVKKLLVAGGVLVAVIVAVVVFLASNLDHIVKKAIETLGPELLQAPVSVAEVRISATDGTGVIRGLVIGNPKGFREPTAFRLGEIRLAIEPASIARDVVVVRELAIEAPEITYEKAGGTSNVETLEKNIDNYVNTHLGGAEKPREPAAAKGKKPETRFIIDSLDIRNGKVSVAGVGKVVPLPAVHGREIGRKQGGVTGAQAARIIMDKMVDSIVTAAAKALVKEGVKNLTDRLFGQ